MEPEAKKVFKPKNKSIINQLLLEVRKMREGAVSELGRGFFFD